MEAVFEVRYQSSAADLLHLGALAESVSEQFPVIEVAQQTSATPGTLTLQLRESPPKLLRLYNEQRTILASFGFGTVSVSAVPAGGMPGTYVGFELLKEKTQFVLEQFLRARDSFVPTRLGYRLINQIEVSEQLVDLGDLLNVGIYVPELFSNPAWGQSRFSVQSVLQYGGIEPPIQVAIRLAPKTKPDNSPFLELDIDYFSDGAGATRPDELLDWMCTAHEVTGDVFESCITDQLRLQFNSAADISPTNEAENSP
jgi:uncharacterized protein (TIGR04255 family)